MSLSQASTLTLRLARWSSALALASLTALAGPQLVARAQSIPHLWEANYQPPAGIGAPRRVEGGASRRPDFRVALAALVPSSNQFGVTTAARPTIFAYMPVVQDSVASLVEFELVDAAGRSIYFTELEPVTTSGIVGLRLPKNAPELEVGRAYRWVVTVYDQLDEVSGQTMGLIQRVEQPASVTAELAQATSAYERAMVYVEARLWYDALAAMAAAYRETPTPAIRDSWAQLLRSAGLDELDRAALLDEQVAAQ